MSNIPPGIAFLASRLHRIVAPPIFVYALHLILASHLHLPAWVLWIALICSFPAALMASNVYAGYVNKRDAAAHGATLAPRVPDKWPGGLILLRRLVKNFKEGYPSETIADLAEEYGNTYTVSLLFEDRTVTFEPEYIKAILATQFDSFQKGPHAQHLMDTLLGTGVFNSDGDMWKFHRAMTRPFFSKERIGHFDIFEHHTDQALNLLKDRHRGGFSVDFQDLVSRFALDSATDFLFGNSVDSLSAGLPYPFTSPLSQDPEVLNHPSNVFARAFSESQILTALRARYGRNWALFEFWKDKVKEHMVVVEKFIDPILVEAVAKQKAFGENAEKSDINKEVEDGDTFLDHLVKFTQDQKILKDEIMNILIAGRDTTACTLTFMIYMLTQHPQVLSRLREEIMQKIGNSRRPTYDDLRDMKYLRAVINETLRLYPPVPANLRTTTKATIWPSKLPGGKPFYIPADTKTPYSVLVMQRRTDLWGPDALEFDPDRFIDERLHKYLTPNPFIFLPFNAGPRICLGQQFAYNEISFFIIRLLQRFSSMSLASDDQPPSTRPPASWAKDGGPYAKEKIWPKSTLTLYVDGGLWVKMEDASDVEAV